MQARRFPECLDEGVFQIRFAGMRLVRPRPANRRSLHEEYVDVFRRAGDHCLEQRPLAPVPAKVTRVEHPLAVRLHQQRVGVECAVIDQIRGHPERSDVYRFPVFDEARRGQGLAASHIAACRTQHAVRRLTDIDRDVRPDLPCQTVVVRVRMRNDHAEQAVVPRAEAWNRRQQVRLRALIVGGVERKTDIQHQAPAVDLDLDAGAADFLRSPMDAQPHPVAGGHR